MTRNEFDLLYAVKKYGSKDLLKRKGLSGDDIPAALNKLQEKGWIDTDGITEKGLEALLPYKADNAVIMAAGMSNRFVPLSLEKPKGLLSVKNEVLIERQIEQLKAAGIRNIVIILGYKKEAFLYLADKYEGITFVNNPEYNAKNNTHTLYLAQEYIKNTYICSSDDYFAVNPFDEYVYQSYYAAIHVTEETDEWYMTPDSEGNIAGVKIGGTEGDIMLGHAYWNRDFSAAMLRLLNDDHEVGHYDGSLWETVLMEHLTTLPPMEIKVYPQDVIYEFDSLEELRAFDQSYVNHTNSRIMENIARVFGAEEGEITHFKTIERELEYISFAFEVKGSRYIYLHPEEGKEAKVLQAASKQEDTALICADEKEGFRISRFTEEET